MHQDRGFCQKGDLVLVWWNLLRQFIFIHLLAWHGCIGKITVWPSWHLQWNMRTSHAPCSTNRLYSPCPWRSEPRAKHCFPCPAPRPSLAFYSHTRKWGRSYNSPSSQHHSWPWARALTPATLTSKGETVDRRSVHITGQMFDNTLVKLYLYWVCGQAVPQREDALVSDNLWETVNHSSEMDVDST